MGVSAPLGIGVHTENLHIAYQFELACSTFVQFLNLDVDFPFSTGRETHKYTFEVCARMLMEPTAVLGVAQYSDAMRDLHPLISPLIMSIFSEFPDLTSSQQHARISCTVSHTVRTSICREWVLRVLDDSLRM